MVRNTPSVPDIRGRIADLNLELPSQEETSSLQEEANNDSTEKLETLGTRLYMPLHGESRRAKFLMNRVATGEATEAEQDEFNDHVSRTRQAESIKVESAGFSTRDKMLDPPKMPTDEDIKLTNMSKMSKSHPDVVQQATSLGAKAAKPSLAPLCGIDNFQRQLWQLDEEEEQRKKNFLKTRQATNGPTDPWDSSPAPPAPRRQQNGRMNDVAQQVQQPGQPQVQLPPHLLAQQQYLQNLRMGMGSAMSAPLARPDREDHATSQRLVSDSYALHDYHRQLQLLEHQNRIRKQLASQEQSAGTEGSSAAQPRSLQGNNGHAEALEPERRPAPPQASQALTNPVQPSSTLPQPSGKNTAMRIPGQVPPAGWTQEDDDRMQLFLLEQQNKKRQILASNLAEDKMKPDWPRRCLRALAEKEKQDLGYGTPNSTWEQLHTPQLYWPLAKNTELDVDWLEKMWMSHLSQPGCAWQAFGFNNTLADDDEALRFPRATRSSASVYTKPFCDWLTANPTVFHAVDFTKRQLKESGWIELDERDSWDLEPSGRYFVTRNGSSMIAFVVGAEYKPGNGAAILAGHVDALTAKLKPISEVPNKAGYLQLGVAPYAGGMNSTWWDRDLGIGGRVLVKEGDKAVTKLVKLDWPIARIPTLAPHFGQAAAGPFNQETQMVPIIGLEGANSTANECQTSEPFSQPSILGGEHGPVGNFVNTQPKALVKAIGDAVGLNASTYGAIINWELELFDIQPATVGGLNKEFIFAARIDDKLCSWAAMQALTGSAQYDTRFSSIIKVVGWFDNEEIGSQLRQGARSNFLPKTLERAVGSLAKHHPTSDLMGQTYASSFILSSDCTHAVNPNFLGAYLENHAPHLNVGLCVAADSNGHMTTDAVSTAILQRCADRIGAKLQVFQIRNDSRSGGTVGPMLSSMTGIRAIDAGIPQLSMHSIRATTGSLDPGLGVIMFTGFLNGFERVDKEFRS